MESRRVTRYLRIAVSVLCLTVCVLLVALWVRSYWWMDGINAPAKGTHLLICQSIRGKLAIDLGPISHPTQAQGWIFSNIPLEKLKPPTFTKETGETNLDRVGLGWSVSSSSFSIVLPHWVFAILCGLSSVAAWAWPDRFSVRTLLIGMTIVAVALGLIIFTSK